MSEDSIHRYSSFSPQDLDSNASSGSPASQSGSGYDSLPLHLDSGYDDLNDLFEDDAQQHFDSLSRIQSPDPFLSDLSTTHSQQPPPPSNQEARTSQQEVPRLSQGRYSERISESPDPFEEFTDLTPPRTFDPRPQLHNPASRNTTPESNVVDLTYSPVLTTMPLTRKRRAKTPGEGRPTKVARRATPRISKATPAPKRKTELDEAEVVDLVALDDHIAYEEFKKKQQEDLIKQQQQDEANRPVKLAEFQCIVCMDNPTDLTVTHCGHLFCSECLHQAMYAGNAKKTCPVCRSAINVTAGNRKKQPKNGIYALEIKLMTSKKKGKLPVRDLQEVFVDTK